MNILKSGCRNQMSGNGTLDTREYSFLERLYKKATIKDYTFDGWIKVGSEWVPTVFGLKKLGENVYNEYIEHCRQED